MSPGYTGRLGLAVYCYHSDQIFLLDIRQNIISSGHCSPSDKNHCNKISTPPFPLSIEYYAGDIEMYYLISRTILELTKYIEQLIRFFQLRRRNRTGEKINIDTVSIFFIILCSPNSIRPNVGGTWRTFYWPVGKLVSER